MKGGMPVISGVGSTAVRDALEKYQPMLSLHGHIHESRGEARIGRTLAINPGSEYSEGRAARRHHHAVPEEGGAWLSARRRLTSPAPVSPRLGPDRRGHRIGPARAARSALRARRADRRGHRRAGLDGDDRRLRRPDGGGLARRGRRPGARSSACPCAAGPTLTPNRWNHELRWSDTLRRSGWRHLLAADAVVALDGGIGTLSEAAVVWAALQTEPDAADLVFLGAGLAAGPAGAGRPPGHRRAGPRPRDQSAPTPEAGHRAHRAGPGPGRARGPAAGMIIPTGQPEGAVAMLRTLGFAEAQQIVAAAIDDARPPAGADLGRCGRRGGKPARVRADGRRHPAVRPDRRGQDADGDPDRQGHAGSRREPARASWPRSRSCSTG